MDGGTVSNEPADRVDRTIAWAAFAVDARWAWLLAAVGTTAVVYAAYLVTHPYPAYAGGLYLQIAEEIIQHGYALPARIPGYTTDGIPFAYPPLMFYVTAAILDVTGMTPLALARYFPGFVILVSLVPYFGITEELLDDTRMAGLATLLLGVTPTTLRWHLSAGGLVRAPAFLLALTCIYTGIKLFRTGDRRWVAASTVLFGLLVMTHPTYTVFVVMSYLLLFATFDRSVDGFLRGTVVGIGGLLLATPWVLQIATTHGLDIFTTAAGTHGGLAGGPYRLAVELTYALDDFDVEWPFYVAAYLGGAYALYERRYFLPVWMVASSYLIGKNRFLFVAGSMLTALLVFEGIVPRIRRSALRGRRARAASTGAVALVVLMAVAAGAAFGTGAAAAAHEHSASQPSYMDDADREAMRWIERSTAQSAEFAVLGDAAEYLPLYTDRTIVLGFWGVEWESTEGYYEELARYDSISACDSAACVTVGLHRANIDPDYVYIPTGHYTVRGKEHVRSSSMAASLEASSRYTIVYENDGVLVARTLDDASVGDPP